MRLGLHLPNSGVLAGRIDPVGFARQAEEVGFDALWVFDHLFNPVELRPESRYPVGGAYYNTAGMPYYEAMTTLSVVAGATRSIQLGTRVLIAAYRNPVLLAKQVGTLTALAGDRLVLGLGVGWMREEFEAVGVDPSERYARLDEAVALMRQAWRDGTSEFSGRFTSHVAAGFHPVPGRPVPLLMGGSSDAALRRVARWADGWAIPTLPKGADGRPGLSGALNRLHHACDTEGRDPATLRLAVGAGIDDDAEIDAFAAVGVDDIDLVLRDPADLDLQRPARRLEALRTRLG
jgi:probable F420-dependent oxidoreductase